MTTNSTFVRVILPSGNAAIYEVTPLHLTEKTGLRRSEFIRGHAPQRAHQADGQWFKARGWEPITEPEAIALIEACPLIED